MGIAAIQLVNYTLSFLMWMIVGRTILTLIVGGRQNIMLLAFVKITEPVYRATRALLPFAGARWAPALSFFLLAAVRVTLILLIRPAAGR